MATIRPFLGDIEGSAGNVTFDKTGGVNILKQKVGPNSSKSPAQLAQRAKFGAIGRLASKMTALVRAGYKRIGLQTGYSRFVGINTSAVSLDANGAPLLDYGMVEVSSGNITPLMGLAVASSATGQTVSWADNSDGNGALSNDKVYLAVVKKTTGEVITQLGAVQRNAGTAVVAAPLLVGVAAADLAVYAFAKRAIGGEASNTTRLGGGGGAPAPSFGSTLAGPSGTSGGVTLTASAGDSFGFNALTTGSSTPASMVINVAGTQVATVDYLGRYAGAPFSYTKNGVTRTGAFAATVNF